MTVTRSSLNVLVAVALLGVMEFARPVAAADESDRGGQRTVRKFPADQQQGPLARLIRTPDTSGGQPPYALTDQTGRVQRYVEPVRGIDLEPYVGYVVVVNHDTGRTLLASQLDLPGAVAPSLAPDHGPVRSLADDFVPAIASSDAWQASSQIQPVQYQQPMPAQQYAVPQGAYPVDPAGQVIMPPQYGNQKMVPPQYGNQPMMGQGVPPVYLDDPSMAGGGSCPSCPSPASMGNVWVVPPTGPQPCQQTAPYQAMPYQQPCPQTCPQPCPPPEQRLSYSVYGEVLWLQASGVDMAHAQQQNGIGGAGTVPWGQIGTADPNYDLGYRFGGEIRLGDYESVLASYTFFSTSAVSNVSPPDIPGGDGAVESFVRLPEAAVTASDGPVHARYDIDFQLGDLAYRQIIACDPRSSYSMFLGARYGHLDQDFTQSGTFAGGGGGPRTSTTSISVDAIGPMAGLDAEHQIGVTRFSVYGHGLIAALTGQFNSRYLEYNTTTGEQIGQSIWKDDRIIPMLDYELGVAWTSPNRHFRLAAGYMTSYWFNIVSTPTFVDAVKATDYVNVSDTIAFDGAVGHVEFRW